MKTILVPVDYSDYSDNALLYALEVARVAKAGIMLFHSFYPVTPPPASYNAASVITDLEKRRAKELEAYASEVFRAAQQDHTGVSISYVCRMGTAYDQIIQVANLFQVDLVVMGMQGGGAISQALIGSTTLDVMLNIAVPVLAVPKNGRFKPLQNIVFATDLIQIPETAVLHTLCELVKVFDARLQVLHLYKGNSEAEERQRTHMPLETLELHFCDITYTVFFRQYKHIPDDIQQFVQEQQADLVVVMPHRHNLVERLLDRSVTGRITARATIPLLAMPSAKAAAAASESRRGVYEGG